MAGDRSGTAAGASLTRSRVSVAVVFCLNGFLAALWVAHIPVITERTGTSHELLGAMLLLIGGSGFVAMQICGPIIDRIGSKAPTIAAVLLLSVAMLGPVLATDPTTLAIALAGFGFANGLLDVSMNAQAVSVERAYRRPIMSAFHGFFSVGGLAGSGVVALGLWFGWPVTRTVSVLCAAGVLVLVAVAGGLAKRDVDADLADAAAVSVAGPAERAWWRLVDRRRLIVLALLAFALMLAEGTAYDWSALHIVETFGTTDALGAVAFGCFSAAMMVARFVVDPIAHRVGAEAVVRGGALLGIVGVAVVLLPGPSTPGNVIISIVGWTLFGLGLAGLIPQIFTAAGNLTDSSSGRVISTVVGVGYFGMLAGPAIVGFIAGQSSLRLGLTPVLVVLAFAVIAAGVVSPARAVVSRDAVSDGSPPTESPSRDTLER